MIKKTKAKEKKEKVDYLAKMIAKEKEERSKNDGEGVTDVDSSEAWDRKRLDDFNSEMDIYSDNNSMTGTGSPRKPKGMHASKGFVRNQPMRAIPAEDSEEEKGSRQSGDGNGSEEREEEDEELDEEESEDDRLADLDERDRIKKEINHKKHIRKEEEQLCGPRFTKKIDDFILGINVEAGIADEIEV